ncbi:MAG: hypothetical protein IJG50_08405 [Clostridia bacterium]|nr:hypothetical protein [Clostridia bacterium]
MILSVFALLLFLGCFLSRIGFFCHSCGIYDALSRIGDDDAGGDGGDGGIENE